MSRLLLSALLFTSCAAEVAPRADAKLEGEPLTEQLVLELLL